METTDTKNIGTENFKGEDIMFIALNNKGERVTIEEAVKGEKYICPDCNSELIQKRGSVNIHHFAHMAGGDCDTWSEMTEWHLMWQNQFQEQYREVTLGEHRADIKVDDYIIEFQHSPISEEELRERINFYTSYGKLIFLFDLREKQIYSNRWRKNTFIWKYPSRTIIPPNNKNYFVFFQISDNTILFVKNNIDNWSDFEVYKAMTKAQFVNLFKKINSIEILKASCQKEADIEAEREQYKEQRKLLLQRISGLEKDMEKAEWKYEREIDKKKSHIHNCHSDIVRLQERERKQHDHIKQLYEDIRQVKKGKIVEKIVEVEVPVIKEVQVEKIVQLNKKQVVDAVILELGRYISCAKTNEDRERAYPRRLFEERIEKVIDAAYGVKVS